MDRVSFTVDGVHCSVGGEVSSDMMLVDYIRNVLERRGTKYMCREAGCGACIVSVARSPDAAPISVNSCMVSVTSCQDWVITTVQHIGNRLEGYHDVQTTLAKYNGTQCGHCSPGWVMAMYSLLKSKKDLTMLEIEQSFGSNVCRCTGYRSILDAFKQFAKDAPKHKDMELPDIEDLIICKKTGKSCNGSECDESEWCVVKKEDSDTKHKEIILKDGKKWYKVQGVKEILDMFLKEGVDDYMLVSGNTAKGAYPILEYPRTLIDISDVPELKASVLNQNLIIGAGLTLNEVIDIFERMSHEEYFSYLSKLASHLMLVAHIPVRNIGTVAGNLMIKHQHHEFQSDVFLLLSTVGAQLTIVGPTGISYTVSMQDFLITNMTGCIILNVLLPPLNKSYELVTYKIMPRAQSAHAIVNAGFLYKLSHANTVVECRIVYGGLSPSFSRAYATERSLIGKTLFTNETLQSALKVLDKDLVVTVNTPPEPSVKYRKQLALALFYKGLLSLCPRSKLNPRYASGVVRLRESRPVSEGRQIFDTNPAVWPLNKPIPKVDALIQCAGEAEYSEDLPTLPHEVFAAFVLSTAAVADIVSIDPSHALSQPGVIAFYSAKDIPGINTYTPGAVNPIYTAYVELLASKSVKYYNEPVGIIVAETKAIAERASTMVHVTYANIKTPVLDLTVSKTDPNRVTLVLSRPATRRGTVITRIIKGSYSLFGQYPFTMETIVSVAQPTEEGIQLHAATQWMDGLQMALAKAINIDINKIDIYVRRLGGGYGMKISSSSQVYVGCGLVTHKLNRPCRFIQSLTSNTRALGKRYSSNFDYEVGVNDTGEIQYMNYNLYEDNGFQINEILSLLTVDAYNNCYDGSTWNANIYDVTTDKAKNTWCRSPGTLECIASAEVIMERISYELSLDPIQVRLANLDSRYEDIREMVEEMRTKGDFTTRKAAVDKFNLENRWKKRGLRFSLMRWTPVGTQYFNVTMSVYHGDGTVSITHGGIEMGQGIDTKAIQTCAYLLKLPLDKINIKTNNTMIAPNSFITGGSLTSQNIVAGVRECCEELLRRLDPIRTAMPQPDPTWEEVITAAFTANINLQTNGFINARYLQDYNVLGVTLTEVEVDILTGESEILRVDILEDVGMSISPEVDVGQVEGAFVMGLGYWLTEELKYNLNTGEILSDRTWNYHVPQARDIPEDFRVYFKKNSNGYPQFLGSKAVGEPPLCMAISIPLAIREAIVSARSESGLPSNKWFDIDGPYTLEQVCLNSATNIQDFKYY